MPRRILECIVVCMLCLVQLSQPLDALAQDSDTMQVVPLGPVVVTAARTPQVLSSVPYAISVVDAQDILEVQPGLGLDEALVAVPGVQVDNRYNYALGERISIRGFGARAAFGVRGVKVSLDGIPATLPDGQTTLSHVDVGALGKVEVLRGPASALHGNAAGGVIQLETEVPFDVPFGQQVTAVGGQHGLLRLQSISGGRRGDTEYALHLTRLAFGGYRDHSSATNWYGNGRLQHRGRIGTVTLAASAASYDAENPGSLSDSLLRADRTQAYTFNVRQGTREAGRHVQAGATIERQYGPGDAELTVYGLFRDVDNPIPPAIIDLRRTGGGIRALYRAQSIGPGAGLRWTAGLSVDTQFDDRQNFENEEGTRGALTLDQDERVRNLAGFAQASTLLAPSVHLLGSLRYDHFHFRADDDLISGLNRDDSGNRAMGAWSPSLGLTWTRTEQLNVFANASTAFETPTTTELVNSPTGAGGFNPSLEPQYARSLEAGARGRLRGRLAYEAAVYIAEVDDALIPFEDVSAPGRRFFRNAGSATHRGFEIGLYGRPIRGILSRAAYTFTDARFDEYATDDASYGGNRIPGVEPHRFEIVTTYTRPSGVFATLELRTASSMFVEDANRHKSDAYAVLDVRMGVEDLNLGGLFASAFVGVENVSGEVYNTSVAINAYGGRYYEPGPGRTLYLGISLSAR